MCLEMSETGNVVQIGSAPSTPPASLPRASLRDKPCSEGARASLWFIHPREPTGPRGRLSSDSPSGGAAAGRRLDAAGSGGSA